MPLPICPNPTNPTFMTKPPVRLRNCFPRIIWHRSGRPRQPARRVGVPGERKKGARLRAREGETRNQTGRSFCSRFLRALFQFSKRAAGEATKFGRSGVELLGVVCAARLESGEPAAEAGELIRR